MRAGGRLRVGRVLALGLGVWFRRFVPIHVVTAVCLAPLLVFAERKNPFDNGTMPGLFGLYSAAWTLSMDIEIRAGFLRNATVGYLAQFAVTVLLVREAHRRLAGRPPRSRLRALLGLLPHSLLSLAVFAALDLAVAATFPSDTPLPAIAAIAVSVVQTCLAAAFWLAIPAAAADGHGPLAALGRSRHLSRGSRFAMAVTVVLLLLLEWGSVFVTFSLGRDEWAAASSIALFVTMKACVLAAAYREICLLKEGLLPDEIGAIFA